MDGEENDIGGSVLPITMPRKITNMPPGKKQRVPELANVRGDRGEGIFKLAITDYKQFPAPLFRTAFLGEKWELIDFYVELLDVPDAQPFFFVQVKTSASTIRAGANKFKIVMEKADCEGLYRIPAPTYLVGVHEPMQKAYILSIHDKPTKGVYSIPLKYELTPDNLKILHQEVREFWKSSGKPTRSHFV